ncbi:MAG TPA: hypothetical protein VIF02_16355 [Methylocella sp.]
MADVARPHRPCLAFREARRRHPSYSMFADVVAFPNLPFMLFAASSDSAEIVIRKRADRES